jgi:hypothetical protein
LLPKEIDITDFVKKYKYSDSGLIIVEQVLGIQNIRSTCENNSIRIWYELGGENSNRTKIITIHSKFNRVTVSLCEFFYKEKGKKVFLVLDKDSVFNEPKSGWKSFIDSLNYYKIYSNADEYKLIKDKLVFVEGGNIFTFQSIRDAAYNTYSYVVPSAYAKKKYPVALNVYHILKLIQKELGIDFY